jgi:hypothetical protein
MESIVCSECFQDEYLKTYVVSNTSPEPEEKICSYCGRKSFKWVELYNIAEYIKDCIEIIYDDINNLDLPIEMLKEEDEDGFSVERFTTEELICNYEITSNSELFGDLLEEIGEDMVWSYKNIFEPSENYYYQKNWELFKQSIMSECRYFYFHKDYSGDGSILSIISDFIIHFNLVEEHENIEMFRARKNGSIEKYYTTAEELGPPKDNLCKNHNRMSAAGIPIFYGALDAETAIKEIYIYAKEISFISVGKFLPSKKIRLINFEKMPKKISIFDEDNKKYFNFLSFMRGFVEEISQPVKKDGEEHLEYVPTQVIAEYFRYIFKDNDKKRIDGIIYKSSINPSSNCCAIFCKNEECEDLEKYQRNKRDKKSNKRRRSLHSFKDSINFSRYSNEAKTLLVLHGVEVFNVSSKFDVNIEKIFPKNGILY